MDEEKDDDLNEIEIKTERLEEQLEIEIHNEDHFQLDLQIPDKNISDESEIE